VALRENGPFIDDKAIAGEALLLSTEGTQLANRKLAQAAIVMRKSKSPDTQPTLNLIYPADTIILEARPYFEWQLADEPSVEAYRLEILSDKGKVLYSTHTNKPRLRLPKDVVLPRGERLTWELEAKHEGKMTFASADFALATEKQAKRVEEMRAQAGTDFARLVLLAQFLEANNLAVEAHDYWCKLAKLRPDSPVLKNKANKNNP
jgi:hypothetical protein